jgi:hypothetical protein
MEARTEAACQLKIAPQTSRPMLTKMLQQGVRFTKRSGLPAGIENPLSLLTIVCSTPTVESERVVPSSFRFSEAKSAYLKSILLSVLAPAFDEPKQNTSNTQKEHRQARNPCRGGGGAGK